MSLLRVSFIASMCPRFRLAPNGVIQWDDWSGLQMRTKSGRAYLHSIHYEPVILMRLD